MIRFKWWGNDVIATLTPKGWEGPHSTLVVLDQFSSEQEAAERLGGEVVASQDPAPESTPGEAVEAPAEAPTLPPPPAPKGA